MVDWWRESNHNKSEMTYELLKNEISFIGLDEPAKLHGRKQDIFWINEAIGTPGSAFAPSKEIFDQLEMRTTGSFFMDYNPKVTRHWIYDSVLTRKDVVWIHSTMLDNPFLEQSIKSKILSFEPTAENKLRGTADKVKWEIYGLGKRAQHEGIIFQNVNYVRDFPVEARVLGYGLDFGFTNDPTALVKVGLLHGELWLDELIYETALTNSDIDKRFRIIKPSEIIADSAEPKSIEELRRMGWSIKSTRKGKDSITQGIDIIKRYKLNVTERSLGLKSELENYAWKEIDGRISNEPIDSFNHSIDALRYVALDKIGKPSVTTGRVYG